MIVSTRKERGASFGPSFGAASFGASFGTLFRPLFRTLFRPLYNRIRPLDWNYNIGRVNINRQRSLENFIAIKSVEIPSTLCTNIPME